MIVPLALQEAVSIPITKRTMTTIIDSLNPSTVRRNKAAGLLPLLSATVIKHKYPVSKPKSIVVFEKIQANIAAMNIQKDMIKSNSASVYQPIYFTTLTAIVLNTA